jgi:hypothetical protein
MPYVSKDFLLAALRLVEYGEDDERKHFEEMERNGEDTDGHIYLSINKVRTDLVQMNIWLSPEAEERGRKWQAEIEEHNILQAWKYASANHPGARPDELIPELRLELQHRGYGELDMGKVIDVLTAYAEQTEQLAELLAGKSAQNNGANPHVYPAQNVLALIKRPKPARLQGCDYSLVR